MPNPFLAKKEYIVPYASIWILIAGVQMAVLYFFSDQELGIAIIDSVIFNAIYAALGLSVWYAVRYYDSSSAATLDILLYHLATAAVALGAWLAGGYFLLMVSLPEFENYKTFLDSSLPWRAISGLLIYSVMVLIYYLYINAEDSKLRKKKEAELKLQVREAEIDRLKAQINPHFLFNSLNSISSLTISHPANAREMVVKLSSFLRYSLEFKENELTKLPVELDHIQLYLEIEKIRFGDRLKFDFDNFSFCQDCLVPNMILQPLYENAIKHGVYESLEPIDIHTGMKMENDFLIVSIKNSFDPDSTPRPGKGIGLQNVRNRMSLIYQAENLVYINKTLNTFEVVLYIPQKTEIQ
jgi:two-component system LytT family sensor kinase